MASISVAQGTVASRAADEIVARLERLPFTRFHLHLASILSVGTFFDAFDSLAISVALTVVFRTLHIGFVNAGLLISAAYVGQFIGAVAFGWLSETHGRRGAFIYALGLFGLASIAAAFAWSFESLLAIRLIQGIGLGAEVPVAGALFNEFVRGRSRGKVVLVYENIFSWGLLLTPLCGLLLFGVIGENLGWRVLFGIGGIPVLAAIYAAFRLPESARWLADKGQLQSADEIVSRIEGSATRAGRTLATPELRYRADIKPTRFGELFSGMYRKRTALSWTQWFTTYFVSYGYSVWLPTLYVSLGGLPAQRALLLAALSAIVNITVGYSFAFVVDHLGRKPIFIFGFGAAAAGMLAGIVATVLFHATGWPVLFGVGLVTALGTGLNAIGVYVYTPELYPTRMRAWATATGSSLNRAGSFIAPTVVGALLAARLGIVSVFALFCAVSIVGLVVMAALGMETKQRVLEELSV